MHRIATLLTFAAATPLLSAASCSPDSGDGVPSEAALCALSFGRSTTGDASALLGAPNDDQTNADGSGFLGYEYSSGATVIQLELDFGPNHVLTGARTFNLDWPACWSLDAAVDAPSDAPSSPDADAQTSLFDARPAEGGAIRAPSPDSDTTLRPTALDAGRR